MPYVVTSPITYLGRAYATGDAIEPRAHVVGQLVAAGCIKEVPPPVPMDSPSDCAPLKIGRVAVPVTHPGIFTRKRED